MLRDLDLAYETCESLKDRSPCNMCGMCCHQPFITIRDEEIESISNCAKIDLFTFLSEYLERNQDEDKWMFKKINPCVFLDKNNKCAIWDGRPEICKEFPYLVSMFLSRVYIAITNEEFDIMPSISYMDDTWPCTMIIKKNIPDLIKDARIRRKLQNF